MVRRSADGDAVFELTDPIYVDSAGYVANGKVYAKGDSLVSDNIHCGRYYEGDHKIPETSYSSAGCQVVAGSTKGTVQSEAGPWRKFVRRLYGDPDFKQNNYTYMLFAADEVSAVLSSAWGEEPVEVTYGSYNEVARTVQRELEKRGYYKGNIDGDFRKMSVSGLLAFERDVTSDGGASGRTTQIIQDLLGVELPPAKKVKLISVGGLKVSPSVTDVDVNGAVQLQDSAKDLNTMESAVPYTEEPGFNELLEDSGLLVLHKS